MSSKTERYIRISDKFSDTFMVIDVLRRETISIEVTREAADKEATRLNKLMDKPMVQRHRR